MVIHDARPAVRSAMRASAYTALLTRVHRRLQRTARLLTLVVSVLRLRLGSHVRGPSTVGVGRGSTARTPARSSGASQGRSGITEHVAGDAARVGGPGWLEVPQRVVVAGPRKTKSPFRPQNYRSGPLIGAPFPQIETPRTSHRQLHPIERPTSPRRPQRRRALAPTFRPARSHSTFAISGSVSW